MERRKEKLAPRLTSLHPHTSLGRCQQERRGACTRRRRRLQRQRQQARQRCRRLRLLRCMLRQPGNHSVAKRGVAGAAFGARWRLCRGGLAALLLGGLLGGWGRLRLPACRRSRSICQACSRGRAGNFFEGDRPAGQHTTRANTPLLSPSKYAGLVSTMLMPGPACLSATFHGHGCFHTHTRATATTPAAIRATHLAAAGGRCALRP